MNSLLGSYSIVFIMQTGRLIISIIVDIYYDYDYCSYTYILEETLSVFIV